MALKSIRDMFQGAPSQPDLSLRAVATTNITERTLVPPEAPGFTARLPGDAEDHPIGHRVSNPLPGISILELARMDREGKLDRETSRKAQAYFDLYRKMEGQAVYSARNHEFEEPPIEMGQSQVIGYNIGGMVRADRFPDYGSTFDNAADVIRQNPRATSQPEVAQGPSEPVQIDASNEEVVLESLWSR